MCEEIHRTIGINVSNNTRTGAQSVAIEFITQYNNLTFGEINSVNIISNDLIFANNDNSVLATLIWSTNN